MLHKKTIVLIALLFVISGTTSTLSLKWQDLITSPNWKGEKVTFGHPFFQSFNMFLGEWVCIIGFLSSLRIRECRGEHLVAGKDYAKPCSLTVYFIPATCDFVASTMLVWGLTLTHVSVYQMLRGACVIFTGLLSWWFLKRKFQPFHWLGMVMVVIGLGFVGLSSMLDTSSGKDKEKGQIEAAKNPFVGNIVILAAQFIAAAQVVYEEHTIAKYGTAPLQQVGWEGTFGIIWAALCLFIFSTFFNGQPDDIRDVSVQLQSSTIAPISILVQLCAVTCYNGCAVTITKHVSSAARMVLDTLRNLLVWIFSLILASYFQETFQVMQLLGFLVLVLGTAIFKEVLILPWAYFKPDDVKGGRGFLHPTAVPLLTEESPKIITAPGSPSNDFRREEEEGENRRLTNSSEKGKNASQPRGRTDTEMTTRTNFSEAQDTD